MPYGWHDGGWGIAWMIVSWALLVAIVVWIVRSLDRTPSSTRSDASRDRPDAERILEERFARGEISEQELTDKRRVIRGG